MSRRTMSARTPQTAPPAFDPVEMHRRNWPDTCDARLIGFAVALERAHALAARRLAAVAARHDLNPAEFDVLATLRRSGQPWQRTPSEIRTLVLLTSGGLTKVLRQLQARGLVTRSTSGARALALVLLVGVGVLDSAFAADRVRELWPVGVDTLRQLLPGAHTGALWRPDLLDRMPALVMLAALGGAWFSAGYAIFARRDA